MNNTIINYVDVNSIETLKEFIDNEKVVLNFLNKDDLSLLKEIGYSELFCKLLGGTSALGFYKAKGNHIELLYFYNDSIDKTCFVSLRFRKYIPKKKRILWLLENGKYEDDHWEGLIDFSFVNKASCIRYGKTFILEKYVKESHVITIVNYLNSESWDFESYYTSLPEIKVSIFVTKANYSSSQGLISGILYIFGETYSYSEFLKLFPTVVLNKENCMDFQQSIPEETLQLIEAYYI